MISLIMYVKTAKYTNYIKEKMFFCIFIFHALVKMFKLKMMKIFFFSLYILKVCINDFDSRINEKLKQLNDNHLN